MQKIIKNFYNKKDINKLGEYIEFRKQIEDEYINSYYDSRLNVLNLDELFYMFKEKFGYNIILLCHELVDETFKVKKDRANKI